MAPVLGYWNIRGLAQPIRLMLAYTETDYEDKKYAYGPAPDYNRKIWLSEKYGMGLLFPNLPYYIDGDLKITQSVAIMRYLARKHGLNAETEEQNIRTDMAEQQIVDLRTGFAKMCYHADFDEMKEPYRKAIPHHLRQFSEFLGENPYFAGEKLTYVDFMAYEILDQLKVFESECLKGFKNLSEFVERIEKLPTIDKYLKSEDCLKFPLNGDMAYFGSRSSGP